jgi:hypothetical protein
MTLYIRPTVIRTYSVAELCADAASCMPYGVATSDRNLKRDIETIDQPLTRLGAINRG